MLEYEEICPACNGMGAGSVDETIGWVCHICYGLGKIDWTDKIKRIEEIEDSKGFYSDYGIYEKDKIKYRRV